jgi:hypothetical protein
MVYKTDLSTETLRLQGVGIKPAVRAAELESGDVTMWNYGKKETILGIVKETAKTIVFNIKSNDSGYVGTRRLAKDRLVVRID